MFREFPKVKQRTGEPPRRYFGNGQLELFVWQDTTGRPAGFQLCYYAQCQEMALTWKPGRSPSIRKIDSGSRGPFVSGSPLLKAESEAPDIDLIKSFQNDAGSLDPGIASMVLNVLEQLD